MTFTLGVLGMALGLLILDDSQPPVIDTPRNDLAILLFLGGLLCCLATVIPYFLKGTS